MGAKPQIVGIIFYWESSPLETPSKDFHLAPGGGLGWVKWLKNRAEKGFIFHAVFFCTISYLVKILLANLNKLFIQYDSISIMKKQNSYQKVKAQKMVVFVKIFDYYHHKFNFGNFVSCLVKL